ncbi:hypothetical protein MRX96_024328 [Rhipicephalus microplus]
MQRRHLPGEHLSRTFLNGTDSLRSITCTGTKHRALSNDPRAPIVVLYWSSLEIKGFRSERDTTVPEPGGGAMSTPVPRQREPNTAESFLARCRRDDADRVTR